MSLTPPIGVALLSFSHTHQEHWAKALVADPRAVVRAVWDADPRRGAAAAARHATTFAGSLDAVLRRPVYTSRKYIVKGSKPFTT